MVIGVTGGVGSGKTRVSKWLGELGCHVIDADQVARKLVDNRESIRTEIRNHFGDGFFDEAGQLRRRVLGREVFSDHSQLEMLNQIVRPPLIAELKHRIAGYPSSEMVVVDMAILFEANVADWFDVIIVVMAPKENRIDWLIKERGWTRTEITERMSAQTEGDRKIQQAHIVIKNTGTLSDLKKQTEKVFQEFVFGYL